MELVHKRQIQECEGYVAKKAINTLLNYLDCLEDLARYPDFVIDKPLREFEYDIIDCFSDAVYAHIGPSGRKIPTMCLADSMIGLGMFLSEIPERECLARELTCLGSMLEGAALRGKL